MLPAALPAVLRMWCKSQCGCVWEPLWVCVLTISQMGPQRTPVGQEVSWGARPAVDTLGPVFWLPGPSAAVSAQSSMSHLHVYLGCGYPGGYKPSQEGTSPLILMTRTVRSSQALQNRSSPSPSEYFLSVYIVYMVCIQFYLKKKTFML